MEAQDRVTLGPFHHFDLTVSDIGRSVEFYNSVLGFEIVVEELGHTLLSNGSIIFGLRDHGGVTKGDRFDETRVGLDHISFWVESYEEMQRAARALDERGVPRGEMEDQGAEFRVYVMSFRDPDNIQLELTAPCSPTG